MKDLFISVLAVIFVIGIANARRPIFCFVCDSHFDPGCAAPFDNRTYPLIYCPPAHHKCSVTILTERHNDIMMDRYIRDCAMDGHVLSRTSCQMSQNDRTCYCDHQDGCNQNHEIHY